MSPKTKICIDQSGKIEQTEKDTVLCLANDIWDSVTIKSATKRQIQEIFRRHGRPRNFIIFTLTKKIIKSEELLRAIKMTEVGKRLKDT